MALKKRIIHVLRKIMLCGAKDEVDERRPLVIGPPTDYRKLNETMVGLSEERVSLIRAEAKADASLIFHGLPISPLACHPVHSYSQPNLTIISGPTPSPPSSPLGHPYISPKTLRRTYSMPFNYHNEHDRELTDIYGRVVGRLGWETDHSAESFGDDTTLGGDGAMEGYDFVGSKNKYLLERLEKDLFSIGGHEGSFF